jgi:hypothetical protein
MPNKRGSHEPQVIAFTQNAARMGIVAAHSALVAIELIILSRVVTPATVTDIRRTRPATCPLLLFVLPFASTSR